MKKIIRLALLPLFLIILVQPVQGQKLLKRLQEKAQKKVEQKVEERAEKKVDEAIDKELDKIEESLENDDENNGDENLSDSEREAKLQQRMSGIMKGMGLTGEPVPHADSYSFNNLIQMHFESFDKDGTRISEGEFITHLNPNSKSMAYQVVSGDMAKEGQGMFIVDAENDAMIILNDEKGEKSGIIYGMESFFQSMGQEYEEDFDLSDSPDTYLANPNVTKTGRTKTIAGYKCEEYKYNDENSESDIWITKDLKMNTRDFFSTLFKAGLYSEGIGWGYLMEATTINKTDGEKSFMQVTNVDTNSNTTFSLNDYKITNLGSLQMPANGEE